MTLCGFVYRYFLTDISLYLNDFNTKLQGFGITIDVMFYNIKAFEMKLEIFKRNVDNDTFKYFPNLQKHMNDLEIHEKPDIQSLQMQFPSITDSTIDQFSSRFTQSKSFEETKEFIKCADNVTSDKLNLGRLQWIDLDNFEMQLIDLQRSSIWRQSLSI
jgi:uncharacterized protein Usg